MISGVTTMELTAVDNASAVIGRVRRATEEFGKSYERLQNLVLGGLSLGTLYASFQKIVQAASEAEQASNRLTAVLRATGNASGITKREIDELADSMAQSTQFDDESLRNASATILKFGNIYGQVFRDSLKVSADLAAFLGTDVVSAAQMVGKSVQSPTEGLTMMEKQFGKLTLAEKQNIEELAKHGKAVEAQNAVLDLWREKIGGTADLMNTGVLKGTRDVTKGWNELLETMGKLNTLRINDILGGLARLLEDIKKSLEGTRNTLTDLMTEMAGYLSTISKFIPNLRVYVDLLSRAGRTSGGKIGGLEPPAPPSPPVILGGHERKAIEDNASAYRNLVKSLKEKLLVDRELNEVNKLQLALDAMSAKQRAEITPEREKELKDLAAKADLLKTQKTAMDAYIKGQGQLREVTKELKEAIGKENEKRNAAILSQDQVIDQIQFETRLIGLSNDQRQIAIAMRALETSGIEKQDGAYTILATKIYDALKAQQAVQEAHDLTEKARDEFNSLWSTVESTGKQAFIHLMSEGKGAFESIGKSIKTAVIDLLYQLTARKWLIQIGAGIETSLYGASASAATNQAAGSYLGSAASGAYNLMTGNAMNAPAWYTQGIADGTIVTGATTAGAGVTASQAVLAGGTDLYAGAAAVGGESALAAIPVYGWIALAAIAAYAIWSDNEDDRPPNPALSITTSGIGGPAGTLAVTQSGLAGGEDVQQWRNVNAWLDQLPDRLKVAIDNMGIVFDPGTTSAQAWTQMETQIRETADSLKLTGDEMQHLDTIANQTAYAANEAAKASEVAAAAQADYTAAMALQASTMSALERMLPVQRQTELAQERLNAVLEDYNLLMPETVQAAYDYMATLDPMSRQYQDLSAVVDDFGIVMTATATEVASAADDMSGSLIKAFVKIRPEWTDQMNTYFQQGYLDQFQKAGYMGDQTVESITAFLQTASQEELVPYLQWLVTLSPALQDAAQGFLDLVPSLTDTTAATDKYASSIAQLNGWLNSIALDSQLSPLSPQAKLDAAQSTYVEDLLKAQGGDLTALANITKEADAYLAAQKAMSGFGGDYSAVYAAVVDQIQSLTDTLGSDRPATSADITALTQEIVDLKTVLARQMERGDANDDVRTDAIVTAIGTSGSSIVSATTNAAVINERQ